MEWLGKRRGEEKSNADKGLSQRIRSGQIYSEGRESEERHLREAGGQAQQVRSDLPAPGLGCGWESSPRVRGWRTLLSRVQGCSTSTLTGSEQSQAVASQLCMWDGLAWIYSSTGGQKHTRPAAKSTRCATREEAALHMSGLAGRMRGGGGEGGGTGHTPGSRLKSKEEQKKSPNSGTWRGARRENDDYVHSNNKLSGKETREMGSDMEQSARVAGRPCACKGGPDELEFPSSPHSCTSIGHGAG
ncbi:hypothetical protein BX600DRAFT_432548 [Xylariales sp. PMI_506]|nr:hypothetical protein BX600DRAFT_432548 [Xylariales sp. PMI_506]